jgi:hypothetical protein
MATKDEIYISLSPETYRQNKSQILKSQADLLNTLKHLHNLKVIAKQKAELKIRLDKLLSGVIKHLDVEKTQLPTPTLPKTVRPEEEAKEPMTYSPSKREAIDKELQSIQEKLKELNA